MKLYGNSQSSNSRKVELILRHLDLAHTFERVDLATGAQRRPEFLAMNPNGKVPVLVDGDLVLWESTAIVRYLVGLHRPALLGSYPSTGPTWTAGWPGTSQSSAPR